MKTKVLMDESTTEKQYNFDYYSAPVSFARSFPDQWGYYATGPATTGQNLSISAFVHSEFLDYIIVEQCKELCICHK